MKYQHVSLDNEWMRLAYTVAKSLYEVKNWNKKTTPVAVIVSKDNKFLSYAACANGAHAINGSCNRLTTRGSSYDNCEYCQEQNHAERLALKKCSDMDLSGCTIYLYGHYHMCTTCLQALDNRGIKKAVLLKDASVLFNRHKKGTVIGTKNQFKI